MLLILLAVGSLYLVSFRIAVRLTVLVLPVKSFRDEEGVSLPADAGVSDNPYTAPSRITIDQRLPADPLELPSVLQSFAATAWHVFAGMIVGVFMIMMTPMFDEIGLGHLPVVIDATALGAVTVILNWFGLATTFRRAFLVTVLHWLICCTVAGILRLIPGSL